MKLYIGGDSGGNLYRRVTEHLHESGPLKGQHSHYTGKNVARGCSYHMSWDKPTEGWTVKWDCRAAYSIKDITELMKKDKDVMANYYDMAVFFLTWNGVQDAQSQEWVGEYASMLPDLVEFGAFITEHFPRNFASMGADCTVYGYPEAYDCMVQRNRRVLFQLGVPNSCCLNLWRNMD